MTTRLPANASVFSVNSLNQAARNLLEGEFPSIWVEGEISNLARPASGHLYFTLKDDKAQIRAALFRGNAQRIRFALQNGQQVLVRGRISLYAPRGDFQLIADHMEEAGLGALQRAYDALYQQLQAEGLFAAERKQPIPQHPRTIGIVTSASGAALHDVLSVLERRFPLLKVIVYPTQVQGKTAAADIIKAIQRAERRAEVDVLIVGRGGGSLEDLWCFNDESLARVIAACQLPIISAVGHETDFTIADYVADLRAPTPSAAAELVSRDWRELVGQFAYYEERLAQVLMQRLQAHQTQLDHLRKRLRHPGRRLEDLGQRLDELALRCQRALQQRLLAASAQCTNLTQRLHRVAPAQQISRGQQQLARQQHQLRQLIQQRLHTAQREHAYLSQRLHAVSPLSTLARGYSLTLRADGEILRSATTVRVGERIETRLNDGRLISEVIEQHADNTELF